MGKVVKQNGRGKVPGRSPTEVSIATEWVPVTKKQGEQTIVVKVCMFQQPGANTVWERHRTGKVGVNNGLGYIPPVTNVPGNKRY